MFGIPGDSITAIVIGVLYMKNMNPGPTIFTQNPQNIYAVFLLFILANLIMLPLGWALHQGGEADPARAAQRADAGDPAVLHRRHVRDQQLVFDVGVMLIVGVVAFVLEENGFPIAPAILGVVLGGMLEENFITSMIKSDGNLLAFFSRPIAAGLGALTLVILLWPLLRRRRARCRG